MLKFLIAKTPNLRLSVEITKFTAAVLLFAGLCFAAINVNTAENVEIAGFIENESKRVLLVPDSLVLNLNFQTAKDRHSRAGILFFIGEREVSIKADYILDLPAQQFKGTLLADSSWFTGYCGMIECQSKPMPAQQRIEVLKALVSKLLAELNGKFHGLFLVDKVADTVAAPAPAEAATPTPVADSVSEE
ncbi:MAG: hypothetical protein LBQ76_02220 [Candidatus Fibromonas sp.]|jgi:hypothetical protein|nr:hypothetical protein [Candidatus Fibromonas sp.]